MKETEDYRPRRRDGPAAEEDPRLVEAVREYQNALDDGRRPNRREFIARHPEIAAELSACLDGLEFLHSAAPRLQPRDPGPLPEPVRPEGTLGDYQIVREVGHGGMGVVYEAVQISLGRRVALKVLPFAATLDPRHLQRFENEARAAANLHHPHIVPVFAVGHERGVHYYAMQFIDGLPLSAVIDHLRQAPAPAPPAADTVAAASLTHQSVASKAFFRGAATIAAQAAEALEYAHQMGVVHRDIKPANLLIDGRGSLWVTDFGLARYQASPALTSPGDLVGTLRYMSPEQAAGQPVIDPRSDVYSLGATLYELLTQEPAFAGRDRQECLRQILEQEPVPPRRINKAVPIELETIVLKAMARHAEDRYATAKDLADDLRRFLDDRPVQARRPGLQERIARWARRHRRVVAGAVLALMLAVVVLGVTAWRIAGAEARTKEAYQALKDEEARTAEALVQEKAQRNRAEENYRQARKVLDYLTRLGVEGLGDDLKLQPLRRRLLTELLAYYQEFIDSHGDDPSTTAELIETRLRLADLLVRVGEWAKAYEAVEQAMRDQQHLPGGPPPHPPFGGPFGPPRGFARLFLIGQPAVQQDLKLTNEQVKQVMRLVPFPGKPPSGENPATAEQALDQLLSVDQAERLRQIVRQARGAQALLDPDAVKALALRDDQRAAIEAALPKFGRGPGRRPPNGPGRPPPPGPGRGGRPPDINWKRVNEEVLQVLDEEQRAKWEQMRGKPFQGDLCFPPPRRPPLPRGG